MQGARRRPYVEVLNNAVLLHALHVLGLYATKFAKHALGMLAEHGWTGDASGRIRELQRAAHRLEGATRRIIEIEDHVAGLQVRVGENLARVLAGAGRHTGV